VRFRKETHQDATLRNNGENSVSRFCVCRSLRPYAALACSGSRPRRGDHTRGAWRDAPGDRRHQSQLGVWPGRVLEGPGKRALTHLLAYGPLRRPKIDRAQGHDGPRGPIIALSNLLGSGLSLKDSTTKRATAV